MQGVEPAKGGRGKKGGVSEAARKVGIPETTARRRRPSKPRHNTENGEVSPPPKTSPNPDPLMLRQPCTETFQADATVFPLKPARNFLRSSQSTNFLVF